MKVQFTLSVLFALVLVVAVSTASYIWLNPKSEIPEAWNQSEIVAAAIRPNETAVDSDLLAWVIKADSRPLLVQSCILWLRLHDSSGKLIYRICHLYRHPHGHNQWELSVVMDAPIPFEQDFETPPTSNQIISFIDHTEWNWQLDEGDRGFTLDPATGKTIEISAFKYIDGRVCTNAWKRRTGDSFNRDVPSEFLQ